MKRLVLGLCCGLVLICGAYPVLVVAAETAVVAGPVYVCGGVGDEEWESFQDQAAEFNLRLLFAEKSTGAFLAEVKVLVKNPDGAWVIVAEGCGPRFLARLPAGRYGLTIEYQGWQQQRSISIPPKQAAEAVFYFP